jgi:hypothetical protein
MDELETDLNRVLRKIDGNIRIRAMAVFLSRAMLVYGCAGGVIQLLNAWADDSWWSRCPLAAAFFVLAVCEWFAVKYHRRKWSKLLRLRYDFIRLGRAKTASEIECFEQQCLATLRDL